MMRFALPVLAAIAAMTAASAGPTKGPINYSDFQVPSAESPDRPGENSIEVECRGNERTTVIVKGDHRPVAELELLVFAVAGPGEAKPVARAQGPKDLVGVSFVPPRTGFYRIVVRNPAPLTRQNPYNSCYLTIK